MVSGIIPNFNHLLKLCVFFLNTINITLVGLLLFFLSFYRKKREKRKMKKEKRKKREKINLCFILRETTYNTISSKPSSTLGFSKCFVYMLYAIFGTWFSGSRILLRL